MLYVGKCFIIQPFDGGVFDKRYDDVIEPAIKDSGLVPYRVDRDPSVDIPISEIERGIRDACICLADITTDNPNVWFELGFAIAVSKNVVMICAEDMTTKFPFDVQHRNIIRYKTESSSDFATLRKKITERIDGIQRKTVSGDPTGQWSPLGDTEKPSQRIEEEDRKREIIRDGRALHADLMTEWQNVLGGSIKDTRPLGIYLSMRLYLETSPEWGRVQRYVGDPPEPKEDDTKFDMMTQWMVWLRGTIDRLEEEWGLVENPRETR